MWNRLRKAFIGFFVIALFAVSACTMPGNKSATPQSDRGNEGSRQQTGGPQALARDQAQALQGQQGVLHIRDIGGGSYVQVKELADWMNFQTNWNPQKQTLMLGENDAVYEFTIDSTNARKADDAVHLKEAPKLVDGNVYLPVSALNDVLSEDVHFTLRDGQAVLQPTSDAVPASVDEESPVPLGVEFDFSDDAADPYKGLGDTAVPDGNANAEGAALLAGEDGAVAAALLKDINIPAMIARGKTYLGVKYLFGADPYPKTGRFDCSSFTQYLFGKYGVDLPRTARAQARIGDTVSRKNLRVGDMMYFYVPGRFKTNNTVGHVGIYIGNMKMLHSSPLPKNGVQITDINKAYWKRTFLFAKRIVY